MNKKIFNGITYSLLTIYCFYTSGFNLNLQFLTSTVCILALFGALTFLTSHYIQGILQNKLLFSIPLTIITIVYGFLKDEKFFIYIYIYAFLIIVATVISLIRNKNFIKSLFCNTATIFLAYFIFMLWFSIAYSFSPRNGIIFDPVEVLIIMSIYIMFTFANN